LVEGVKGDTRELVVTNACPLAGGIVITRRRKQQVTAKQIRGAYKVKNRKVAEVSIEIKQDL
jgi:hypothetical protein